MIEPISTAPLDGRDLVLFSLAEDGGWIVWQGKWRKGWLSRSRWVETGHRYVGNKPDTRRLLEPLRWMPRGGAA